MRPHREQGQLLSLLKMLIFCSRFFVLIDILKKCSNRAFPLMDEGFGTPLNIAPVGAPHLPHPVRVLLTQLSDKPPPAHPRTPLNPCLAEFCPQAPGTPSCKGCTTGPQLCFSPTRPAPTWVLTLWKSGTVSSFHRDRIGPRNCICRKIL